jgi:gluconate 5-dehydrogenase
MILTDLFSLSGKTALVAGASRGMGLAIARGLAAAGARTILAARSLDSLKQHAAEIQAQGQRADAMELDVTNSESIRAVVEAAGDVDILVNVAGTNVRKPIGEYTEEEYDRVMRTNLHGIVELTRRVGQKMISRGTGGKVVIISSLSTFVGMPFLTVYAMSKSALGGLAQVLAAEWAPHNIQVNCIAPGVIVTDLSRKLWQDPVMADWLKGQQAHPGPGQPEDVVPMAVLLSGPGSNYLTGQTIIIDGGFSRTAYWPLRL